MKPTHVLDCSNMELPEWWPKGLPLVLPLVKGRHFCDWDLVVEEVDAKAYKALERSIKRRDKDTTLYAPEASAKPVGFNNRTIPKGAVIRKLTPAPSSASIAEGAKKGE